MAVAPVVDIKNAPHANVNYISLSAIHRILRSACDEDHIRLSAPVLEDQWKGTKPENYREG